MIYYIGLSPLLHSIHIPDYWAKCKKLILTNRPRNDREAESKERSEQPEDFFGRFFYTET